MNKIICGDCLIELGKIPDDSVDLILTDPPYNISKLNDNRDRSKLNSPIMRRESPLRYDFGEWDNKTREEFMEFTKEWVKQCSRVLKEGGTFISFFNKEDISFLGWQAKQWGLRTRTIFTWCKSNPVPSFRKVNYLSATEFIWIGSKGDKAWKFNFKMQKEMKNYMITSNGSCYKTTNHPTEKPLSLLRHLIEIHTDKDDLILDPFAGSGTSIQSARELGRKFIGCDIYEQYVETAFNRIRDINEKEANKNTAKV